MNKKIFAVCDLEVEYAVNFMEYLSRRQNIPFEIQAFTTVESLLKASREVPIELLLISSKAMCPEVREAPFGKVIILSEGMQSVALDSYPSVYKYQASADVLREVMSCYGAETGNSREDLRVWKSQMKIVGIYSPLHRCMKTSVALTMGQILARKHPVLYFNLEEYSGLEAMLGKSFDAGLSDLLYYVQQEQGSLIHRLNSMVVSVGNLDVLPPVKNPWDLRAAGWEIWKQLLTEIARGSSYEVLILDIGCEMEDLFLLLNFCDEIYMPVLKDRVSVCKLAQFEELLKAWNCPGLEGKIKRIHPPFYSSMATGQIYVEQMLWSELGDYVSGLLQGGSHESEAFSGTP